MNMHSFDVDVAKKVGVAPAVIYANLTWWIAKNKANDEHFIEGHYWTYNSVKAFSELFPYLTDDQVRRAIEKLVDNGLIVTGNHNKSSYDRTKWFRLGCQIHLANITNGFGRNAEPIPDINTNINTDGKLTPKVPKTDLGFSNVEKGAFEKGADLFQDRNLPNQNTTGARARAGDASKSVEVVSNFDDFWKAYPKRKSKPDAMKAYAKASKSFGHGAIMDGLSRALAADHRFKTSQYTPNAASWLNSEGFNDEHQPASNDQFNAHPFDTDYGNQGPNRQSGSFADGAHAVARYLEQLDDEQSGGDARSDDFPNWIAGSADHQGLRRIGHGGD
jgi:hypothetical protein